MIAKIAGLLESIEPGVAVVKADGGLTYEVLVSSYTAGRMGADIGNAISLYTLHYFESLNQGATFIPRLAGFQSVEDRQFFELFTTCKGIGQRKALRAMTLDTTHIASAIADRDVTLLQSLPEIGKRTAETIIATLHGKVDPYLGPGTEGHAVGSSAVQDRPNVGSGRSSIGRQVLETLVQLGENRGQAIQWVDEALRGDDRPGNVEQLLARVYEIKP